MAHKLNPIRIMLVEDSMTTMELLIGLFSGLDDIQVVATAKHGQEAIELLPRLNIDLVLMDINMPILNGYQAASWIMQNHPLPVLLMTASWDLSEVKPIIDSMQLGVVGVYNKPPSPLSANFDAMTHELIEAVRIMAEVKVVRRRPRETPSLPYALTSSDIDTNTHFHQILIGASTGGPPVLHKLLKILPKNYCHPIVIAQHMSPEFMNSFVEWLDSVTQLKVKLAQQGDCLQTGTVYISPVGQNLVISNNHIHLTTSNIDSIISPNIDALFTQVPPSEAASTLAILLTGMGHDGADGLYALHQQGAFTIAQEESSCVVASMPKSAIDKGAVNRILTPEQIGQLLLKLEQ